MDNIEQRDLNKGILPTAPQPVMFLELTTVLDDLTSILMVKSYGVPLKRTLRI